ncbi:uncharacterized protein A1O5_00717 [Cladophialophora psammophila CBS 110553]|uniref:Uncharacterized protein n=1 Tax=Cladophialophora psammophila CBS 110553 TaxID=1182543 RepID=W9Y138_9EURO|nr:uncharacterized protein A1O5_00717 [Cladophialophora psammophila CBS 110553]EXJ76209.1 hypothetical protein A1O5_00717 [Cladophialophora psammophila CBS 110553]
MASLYYLGAIIIILGLIYEPFLHQIISFPVEQTNVTSPDATIKQVLGLDYFSFSDYLRDFTEIAPGNHSGQSAGVQNASRANSTRSLANILPKKFAEQCEIVHKSCDFSFPKGNALQATFETGTDDDFGCSETFVGGDVFLSLNYTPIWPLSVDTYNYTDSDAITRCFYRSREFLGKTNPLLAPGYAAPLVSTPDNETSPPQIMSQAAMCIPTPCGRKYNVSVINGRSETGNFILDDIPLDLHTEPSGFILNIDSALTYLNTNASYTSCLKPLSGTTFTEKTLSTYARSSYLYL